MNIQLWLITINFGSWVGTLILQHILMMFGILVMEITGQKLHLVLTGLQEKVQQVWYSSDGITWTSMNFPSGTYNRSDSNNVFFDGAIWLAGANKVWKLK